jgi:hypothetical protein
VIKYPKTICSPKNQYPHNTVLYHSTVAMLQRILLRLFLDLKACPRMIDSPRLILNIQGELKKAFLGQCNELLNFSNLKTE